MVGTGAGTRANYLFTTTTTLPLADICSVMWIKATVAAFDLLHELTPLLHRHTQEIRAVVEACSGNFPLAKGEVALICVQSVAGDAGAIVLSDLRGVFIKLLFCVDLRQGEVEANKG